MYMYVDMDMWTVFGKTKNICKYFSGCAYTVRKSWKVLGFWGEI